jgi:hypothetical protein
MAVVSGVLNYALMTPGATAASPVRYFDSTRASDVNAAGSDVLIEQRIRTGELRPAGAARNGGGPFAWQRFGLLQVLGQFAGNTDLKMDMTLDAGSPVTATWPGITGTVGKKFSRETALANGVGSALKLELYNSGSAGNAGVGFVGVGVEFMPESGMNRSASSERA